MDISYVMKHTNNSKNWYVTNFLNPHPIQKFKCLKNKITWMHAIQIR